MKDESGEGATIRSGAEEASLVEVYSIAVVQGPSCGKSVQIHAASPGRSLVGKGDACALKLDDPEVSRRHLSLRLANGVLVLLDLGSTNGTFVNGVEVSEAKLRGGESIRLGSSVLVVARGEPSFVSISQESSFGRMLGRSPVMRALYPVLANVAERDLSILIEGEAGVGKRLTAEEIHLHSARASRPFVSVSCRAIADAELERRIFGEGGFVDEADRGTIYIDEVAALPERVQAKLLDHLQSASVRFVLGTRKDLDREVTAKRFREDLFSALVSRRIELPLLRDRDGDVAFLARSFWSKLAKDAPFDTSPELPADFLPRFDNYSWPGNVGELDRAVCTRFTLGEFARVPSAGVRKAGEEAFADVLARELPLSEARGIIIQEFERRYVEHMMARFRSTREAAAAAGVAQRYFQILKARLRE